MSFNHNDLCDQAKCLDSIISDSLDSLDEQGKLEILNTSSARNLLLMIASHESQNFTYVKQIQGPAFGVFQMEELAFNHALRYAARKGIYLGFSDRSQLIFDTRAAIKCARLYLYTFPKQLPNYEDIKGLSLYAKKYWNTKLGKASAEDYEKAFHRIFT